jgi:hypothetical protein
MTDKDKNHDKDYDKDKHAPPPAAKPAAAPGPDPALTTGLPLDAYMTEQEKAAIKAGSPGSKLPYPSGDPPPIVETITRSQGIKGAAEYHETPADTKKKGG